MACSLLGVAVTYPHMYTLGGVTAGLVAGDMLTDGSPQTGGVWGEGDPPPSRGRLVVQPGVPIRTPTTTCTPHWGSASTPLCMAWLLLHQPTRITKCLLNFEIFPLMPRIKNILNLYTCKEIPQMPCVMERPTKTLPAQQIAPTASIQL